MQRILLFCHPGNTYKDKYMDDVYLQYFEITDKLFSDIIPQTGFMDLCEKKLRVPGKLSRHLLIHEGLDTGVKGINVDFNISTYSFQILEPPSDPFNLPDLDIFCVEGEKYVNPAINTIKKYYEANSWKTALYYEPKENPLQKPQAVRVEKNGQKKDDSEIQIFSPYELIRIASNIVGYDTKKINFSTTISPENSR